MAEERGSAPALDPEALARLRRIGGAILAGRMASLFLGLAPDRLRTAREGVAGGDASAVARAAHSLKSSSGNVGALAVTETAGRLEDAAERGNGRDTLATLLAELEEALAAAEPELAALAAATETEE